MATNSQIRYGAGRSSHNSVSHISENAEWPWLCSEEWETVYNWLYSSKYAMVEEGLGRVSAWRARNNVPLMVEVTADLCECRLTDRSRTGSAVQEQSLILQYSMAITRFINGVGEIGKQKLGMRVDLIACANEYGVPPWVVTLRHMGTHQKLPSIGSMRLGAELCLSWLRVNYWRPQRLFVARLLAGGRDPGDRFHDPRWCNMTLNAISKSLPSPPSDCRVTLLTSGLCRTERELELLLQKASCKELVNYLKGKQLLQVKNPAYSLRVPSEGDLDGLPKLEVDEREKKVWSALFKRVAEESQSFKQRLISALVVAVHHDEVENSLCHFLCGWLNIFLGTEAEILVERAGGVEIIQILEKDGGEEGLMLSGKVNWQDLLLVLVRNPGQYSYPLTKLISGHISQTSYAGILPDILQMSRMVTVSSRIGSIYSNHFTPREGSHTRKAEEFMASVTSTRASSLREKASDVRQATPLDFDQCGYGDRWEVVKDVEAWLHCPLGLCPGQRVGAHMLSVMPQDRDLVIVEDCDSVDEMEDREEPSGDEHHSISYHFSFTEEELQCIEDTMQFF